MPSEQDHFLKEEIARQQQLLTATFRRKEELEVLPGDVAYRLAIEENIRHLRKQLRG